LRLVREGAQRMGEMIDGLVGLERIGRVHLSRQALDTRAVVAEAIDEVRPATGDRDVEFRVGDLPACNADPALLRIVFENLIDNAVKFTRDREHGIVEIGADASGRERAFSVRDNGCGFDPRYSANLFGVFQRLHGAGEYDGLGIGLATAHRIITRHGGHIWAESQVGAGATFRFTLGAGVGA
jgi:two-component system, chemotaxis family, sensor kinase Cph1